MILNKIFGVLIFLIIQSNISTYESIIHKNHAFREYSDQCSNWTGTRHKRSFGRPPWTNLGLGYDFKPPSLSKIEEDMTLCFETGRMWCDDRTKYRSVDGSCNNLKYRTWGMESSPTYRIVAARYDDGKCSLHTSTLSGDPPPPTMKISETITNLNRLPILQNVTTFFGIFAQIVADDVISSTVKSSNKQFCCSNINATYDNPSCTCMETSIPLESSTCKKLARSETTLGQECPDFPVYQISSTSSYIDASFLYPPDNDQVIELRTNKSGKLKIATDSRNRPFIMTYKNNTKVTHITERSLVHVNTGTKTIQTMFIRLHNFLCDILSWINPTWDDRTLFQESRRLLIALYQHIVYFEFIPIVVGYDYAMKYDLMPKVDKLHETYDDSINPKTVNSFATAAFRYFHALIPSSISLVDFHYAVIKNVSFIGTAEDIDITQHDWYDSVIRGFTTVSLMNQEQLNSAQRRLLHAMDIERGRDHGLPSYNDYREACGLRRIYDFKHLSTVMNHQSAKILAEIYEDIDEVELYVGGVLENPAAGAIVGPTFQCLIAESFYRYKYGDRFFYEHKNVMSRFTKEQILEIKKATASLLICISSDSILKVQTNAFYLPSTANPFVPCELILRPDYSLWQKKPR